MTTDSLLGQQLDEYRLEALLGQGGMARVYRGLDVRLQRSVAVKVIQTHFREDSAYWSRFEREARAIAQLDHPHIVQVYRFGEAAGLLYLAMQFIDGTDLATVLAGYRREGEFVEPADAHRIISEVCSALDYAHARGVIHRDVKPSNILLDRRGQAVLTDFGLALLPEADSFDVFGSPHYMSPEQAVSSAQVVAQSDLYSVGVILYELFTGQVPFDDPNPVTLAAMQVREPPRSPRSVRPAITPALEAVILKALAKQPADRFASGQALAAALDQALQAAPIESVGAVPGTLSRLSIPDRVALRAAPPPLSPVAPAASPPREPARPPQPGSQLTRTLWFGLAALGAVTLLAWLCGVWWLRSPLIGFPGALSSSAASPSAAATLPATLEATAAALVPTVPPRASATPALSAGTSLVILLGREDDYIAVLNQGGQAVPLASLTLGEGDSALHGSEWGLAELPGGACVTAWKDSDKDRQQRAGLTCIVGELLIREGPDRFWEQTFDVYFNQSLVGTCEKQQASCPLQLTP